MAEEEEVKSFTYLGSIVTIDVEALEDVHIHIKKPNGAFMELYTVWRNKIVRTNLELINTNVKSVLLYGCKTWKITKLVTNSFQMFVN
jgi:hypothetical protein